MQTDRPGPSSRRPDRRRLRTRSALLHAGRALLAARDVEGISIDEIVAAADVAKGSFYNHFRDKEAFAREIGAAVRHEAERLTLAANAAVTDPAARIARGVCVFLRYAIEHPDGAQVLWRLNPGSTMPDAPINRNLRQDLAGGIRAGRFAAVGLQTALLMVMGTVVIATRHVLEERTATAPAALARQMSAALLRALGLKAAEARRIGGAAAQDLLS
jgi:AcrR family transcriptional regulator